MKRLVYGVRGEFPSGRSTSGGVHNAASFFFGKSIGLVGGGIVGLGGLVALAGK